MGPTNIALVQLFRADQALREAQERLDAASKNVRVQERRVNDLVEKHKAAQQALRAQQSKAGQLDLDLKSRDAHIEKLRRQQQTAKNNKEYQAFLIEINTGKVDRGKIEEEAIKVMESVEKAQAEVAALAAAAEVERGKLQTLKEQSGENVARLTAEVEEVRPARDCCCLRRVCASLSLASRSATRRSCRRTFLPASSRRACASRKAASARNSLTRATFVGPIGTHLRGTPPA